MESRFSPADSTRDNWPIPGNTSTRKDSRIRPPVQGCPSGILPRIHDNQCRKHAWSGWPPGKYRPRSYPGPGGCPHRFSRASGSFLHLNNAAIPALWVALCTGIKEMRVTDRPRIRTGLDVPPDHDAFIADSESLWPRHNRRGPEPPRHSCASSSRSSEVNNRACL